jgi:hypothetical protein
MLPKGLKTWFIIHFIVDMIFAIPLMIFPHWFLTLLNVQISDPLLPRLVGAALIGIGGTSFILRNRGIESYQALLSVKIVWSLAAIIGIFFSMLQGSQPVGWIILVIFGLFFTVWVRYRILLK